MQTIQFPFSNNFYFQPKKTLIEEKLLEFMLPQISLMTSFSLLFGIYISSLVKSNILFWKYCQTTNRNNISVLIYFKLQRLF